MLVFFIVVVLLVVVWLIASEYAYRRGYQHAIEDVEALSLAIKKEMEKRDINED